MWPDVVVWASTVNVEMLKEIDYEGLKEVSRIAELSHHNIPQSIAAVKRRV